MKTLAFDTSTQALTVALYEDEQCVASQFIQSTKRQHGEILIPVIEQLLLHQGWQPLDIENIVVGVGPGSYTGLRMGVTLAKTWGSSLNIQVKQVSSLALLASYVQLETLQHANTLIIPIMDARRLSAYTALYQIQSNKLVPLIADCHSDWATFCRRLKEQAQLKEHHTIIIVGNGIDAFVAMFKEFFSDVSIIVINSHAAIPQVNNLHCVDITSVEDVMILAPNYCHDTLAEQEWSQKHGQIGQDDAAFIEIY